MIRELVLPSTCCLLISRVKERGPGDKGQTEESARGWGPRLSLEGGSVSDSEIEVKAGTGEQGQAHSLQGSRGSKHLEWEPRTHGRNGKLLVSWTRGTRAGGITKAGATGVGEHLHGPGRGHHSVRGRRGRGEHLRSPGGGSAGLSEARGRAGKTWRVQSPAMRDWVSVGKSLCSQSPSWVSLARSQWLFQLHGALVVSSVKWEQRQLHPCGAGCEDLMS